MKEFDDLNNPLLRRLFKSKIRNHKKIVRSKDDELRKLETKTIEDRKNIAELLAENESLRSTVSGTKNKVEQLKEEISSLANMELQETNQDIIAKLRQQIEDQAVEHEKQISRLTTSNMALDESLAGLERTIVELRKTIQE